MIENRIYYGQYDNKSTTDYSALILCREYNGWSIWEKYETIRNEWHQRFVKFLPNLEFNEDSALEHVVELVKEVRDGRKEKRQTI